MGCTSSKRIEADVYRPAPTSFALFDINAIEEPWLITGDKQQQQPQEKTGTHVPASILEKLDKFELASNGPHSWSEVSKALEDLKPTLDPQKPLATKADHDVVSPKAKVEDSTRASKPPPRKSQSFHTVEELDPKAKLPSKPTQLKKTESMAELQRTEFSNAESRPASKPAVDSAGFRPLRENAFIVRDRMEREREGRTSGGVDGSARSRWDPLSEYPEKCPPGGADSAVLYTTTLGGVRRTFEDCNRARSVLEAQQVDIDERDVSLHGEFLNELKELVGEECSVPRLFVKGRYIGGIDKVVELNESGRLGKLLKWAGIVRGVGSKVCAVFGVRR
uniref:Glutaredoxin domain-containing protein n=1 Tax=Nelumbo nucifera TaxID=4432 RepID=A0A822YXJ4_NELNU|nr:TPA_asm: hypothetical protein HUJ06_006881 [Nelumbo nucifera]